MYMYYPVIVLPTNVLGGFVKNRKPICNINSTKFITIVM